MNFQMHFFVFLCLLGLTNGCAIDPVIIEQLQNSLVKKQENLAIEHDILRPSTQNTSTLLVAHAMGSVDKQTGTNSKEAFEESYSGGFRLFEVDLSLTKDGHVVALHDNAEPHIGLDKKISEITRSDFKQRRFDGTYTLLTGEDLLHMLIAYPDIYLVTDTKDDLGNSLNYLLHHNITQANPTIQDRIIPQIYAPDDLQKVLALYPFKNIIFTLYRSNLTNEDVLKFLEQHTHEISAITMWWDKRYTPEFARKIGELNVGVYVHTINNQKKIEEFIGNGVGVYTDFFNFQ